MPDWLYLLLEGEWLLQGALVRNPYEIPGTQAVQSLSFLISSWIRWTTSTTGISDLSIWSRRLNSTCCWSSMRSLTVSA